jgi:hypothetical protein
MEATHPLAAPPDPTMSLIAPVRVAAGAGAPPRSGVVRLLIGVTVLGFAARLVLSAVSLGSNDAVTWRWFAALAICTGPSAYELEPTLNHPPIPVVWSCASLLLAAFGGVNFPFLFRLPAIAADVGSCVLLRRIWTDRHAGGANTGPGGADDPASREWAERWGWVASAVMAWNLDAILVGAYHGNTDNVCAFLMLLSAYRVASRRDALGGGLALAAAVNVKLVPVLLAPALLAAAATACGGWRRGGGRFALGLAAGLPPFLLMFALVPAAFARNALAYTPMPGEWGVLLLATAARATPLIAAPAAAFAAWYAAHGKPVVFAAAGAVAAVAVVWRLRRRRGWDAYQLGATAAALFLLLTPGFGLQYTVYAVPLMLAADLRRGSVYGLVAGLYVLATYAGKWDGTWPLRSLFDGGPPNPLPPPIGLVAWVILGGFVLATAWRGGTRVPVAR